MMKKILSTVFALSLSLALFAQEDKVTMPFLAIDQNPFSAAQASISLFDNAASPMRGVSRGYAGVVYQLYDLNSTHHISVDAYSKVCDFLAVRARYAQQLETPYDVIDDWGELIGTFKPQTLRASVGVSGAIGEHVALGLEIGYARRALAKEYVINGVTFNPAVQVTFAGFNAVVGGRNLAPKVASSEGEKFNLPGSVFVSAGYDIVMGEVHHLVPAAEFEYVFGLAKPYCAAGSLCYNWKDAVYVMGGYRWGGVTPSHASAGLGFCAKGFCINATVLVGPKGKIGVTPVVGLGYRF